MKIPEKHWIKKVDAAMILVMRRCLRNYLLIFFGLMLQLYDKVRECLTHCEPTLPVIHKTMSSQ